MSDKTAIEWTDATWNPVTGCTEVSPGCNHCYAKTFAERWRDTPGHYFEHGFDVQLRPDKLDQPLRWKDPRRIFVNSMSDLFHTDVPDEYIADVWHVMAEASQHTFQILTKRHGRMRSWVKKWCSHPKWIEPLPNVWLGCSVEDQHWADIRIPALLDTPAAVRWISAEPLLGPVDLHWCNGVDAVEKDRVGGRGGGTGAPHPLLDWVVVGGESGRGARPMHPDWARSIRDQCQAAGVPFLFKQWGEWGPHNRPWRYPWDNEQAHVWVDSSTGEQKPFGAFTGNEPDAPVLLHRVGKKAAGRELDGRTWDQYPDQP